MEGGVGGVGLCVRVCVCGGGGGGRTTSFRTSGGPRAAAILRIRLTADINFNNPGLQMSLLRNLNREITILRQLDNPRVIRLLDLWHEDLCV